ncbi:MAG TPA: hypothetical protein VF897_16390 [Roseiflexaceae bacterium]
MPKEVWIIVGVVTIIFLVSIWWKIFAKAGYSGALSLLMFIPVVNFILLLILAFGEWPIHRELRLLRERSGQVPVANVYYPPR